MTRLSIPEKYFEDEEREGFLVPAKMKRCWAAKMELVTRMGEIFDRHGLVWWINYGTLLGAVRHRGFIPWDDDIDICMMRDDCALGLKALESDWDRTFGCEIVDMGFWYTFHNRANTDTGEDEEEQRISKEFFDWPFLCNVDIFPMDYVPRDRAKRDELRNMLIEYLDEVEGDENENPGRSGEAKKKYEALTKICSKEGAYGIAQTYWWCKNEAACWPLDCFDGTVRLSFEMTDFPAPRGYLNLLSVEYGNWSTPVKGTSKHDYPCYGRQESWLFNYFINKTVDQAEKLLADGERLKARGVLLEGLVHCPGRYEIFYLMAKTYLGESLPHVYAWLKQSIDACESEDDRKAMQGELANVAKLLGL